MANRRPSRRRTPASTPAVYPPLRAGTPEKRPPQVRDADLLASDEGPSTPEQKELRLSLPAGKVFRARVGMTAAEVFKAAGITTPHPLVAARFRNKVTQLDRPIQRSGTLEPLHIGTRDGALIYRRSLSFVLVRAVADLFPDLRVHVNHSIDAGNYAEVYRRDATHREAIHLSPIDVKRVDARMREIIANDEPIIREEVPLEQAVEIFDAAGMHEKAALLRSRGRSPVSVHRLGKCVDHYYGLLAPSTGPLRVFEMVLEPPGMILRFPDSTNPDRVPPSVPHDKMMGVLREYENWMRVLNLRTIHRLNELIESDKVREYVLIAEALHEKKLAQIADAITHHPRKPRVVLLSGPSSSGKTTSVKRLSIQLRVNGWQPVVVGLDDFFLDRDKTPRDESGEYDFEALEAIDLGHLQECVRALLKGEQVTMPRYDFLTGKSVVGETMRLIPGQILILEGIHALNDRLLPTIPDGQTFKIYASPLTHLNIDDHNRISSSDVRLIRRLVRDYSHRGYDAVTTLKRWPSVRRGERRNIFPYQENADVIFNTSLPYELAVLRPYAISVLQRVKRSDPEYGDAALLLKFLSYFRSLKPEFVPRHSLLREFIGGSCFTY